MQLKEIRSLNAKIDAVAGTLKELQEFAESTVKQFGNNAEVMAQSLLKLASVAGNAFKVLGANRVK